MDLDERWMRRIGARMRDDAGLLRAMDATDEAIDRREELVRRTSIEESRRGDGSFLEAPSAFEGVETIEIPGVGTFITARGLAEFQRRREITDGR